MTMVHNYDDFQAQVWNFYAEHGRELPWRQPSANGQYDPYCIMLSEIMLQQTQVGRVIEKYHQFLAAFPTLSDLANAPLRDVLVLWSGLGYNRRAKFLHAAAQQLFAAREPFRTVAEWSALPGIGRNTAGAILVYTYNQPEVFIETNIRSVFIYHFFPGQEQVSDAAIAELVRDTLPTDVPREWYWALMDYGSHLKRTVANHARSSKTYAKQSAFNGSLRQIRGGVLKQLTDGPATVEALQLALPDERLPAVLRTLVDEQLISKHAQYYQLGG